MASWFLPVAVGVLALMVAVQWTMLVGLNRRFSRQTEMLREFFRGPNGEDLEALLARNLIESREALENSQIALARVEELTQKLGGAVQHFALERYDAFGDVTGQQSFSLALLDEQGGGVVVSALFGRHNSRVFGKTIVNGAPEQPLSPEEQEVLMLALERKVGASELKGQPRKSQKRRFHLPEKLAPIPPISTPQAPPADERLAEHAEERAKALVA